MFLSFNVLAASRLAFSVFFSQCAMKKVKVFRIFNGFSEDLTASYMAAPSKGWASLVWDVVASVIPFRNSIIKFYKKGLAMRSDVLLYSII